MAKRKLPEAVRRQAEEAERVAKKLFGEEESKESTEPSEPTEPTEPVEPAEPEGNVEVAEPTDSTEPTEPTEPVEPTKPPTPEVDESIAEKLRELEHKYSTLQGIHRRLLDENEQMRKYIESLKTPTAPQQPTEPTQPDEASVLAEEYPDIYSGVEKLIEKKVEEKLSSLRNMTYKTAYDRLIADLEAAVPDWKEINYDPNFLEWLSQKDRYSPYTRQELLNIAYEQMDASAIINMFKDYKDSRKPQSTIHTQHSAPSQVNVSKYVAPSTSKRGSEVAPSEPQKKTYSRAEIDKYYRDLALGKIIQTPEEKIKREREYWEAAIEGRIV